MFLFAFVLLIVYFFILTVLMIHNCNYVARFKNKVFRKPLLLSDKFLWKGKIAFQNNILIYKASQTVSGLLKSGSLEFYNSIPIHPQFNKYKMSVLLFQWDLILSHVLT